MKYIFNDHNVMVSCSKHAELYSFELDDMVEPENGLYYYIRAVSHTDGSEKLVGVTYAEAKVLSAAVNDAMRRYLMWEERESRPD